MDWFNSGDDVLGSLDSLGAEIELKHTLARRAVLTQKVGERCHQIVYTGIINCNIEKVVAFVVLLNDSFGLKLLKSFRDKRYEELNGINKFWQFTVPLEDVQEKEPTVFESIMGRMDGLFGYFPIVVAAYEGFSVFPWPFMLVDLTPHQFLF